MGEVARTALVGARGVRHLLPSDGWRTACGYVAKLKPSLTADVTCKLCLDTRNGTRS